MATAKKPKCTYGDKCFRKNKDHLENFDHPIKKKELDEEHQVKVDIKENEDSSSIEELSTEPKRAKMSDSPKSEEKKVENFDLDKIEGLFLHRNFF